MMKNLDVVGAAQVLLKHVIEKLKIFESSKRARISPEDVI